MSDWTSSRSSGPRDWALIEEFLKADLEDRRRARRWRWFRRLLLLIILAALAVEGAARVAIPSAAMAARAIWLLLNPNFIEAAPGGL